MEYKNMQILKRLAVACQNDYSTTTREDELDYKKRHLFLANILNIPLAQMELEYEIMLEKAISQYNESKKIHEHGFFYDVENLLYKRAQCDQLRIIIYGEHYAWIEVKFDSNVEDAHRDLLAQLKPALFATKEDMEKNLQTMIDFVKKITDGK